jgi:helix-turn-helix protein
VLKSVLKVTVKMLILFTLLQLTIVINYYFKATRAVAQVYTDVARVVAEDNCLDNTILYGGKTMYQRQVEKLNKITADTKYLVFESDAIQIPYTAKATAPQQNTQIPLKITGYFNAKLVIFGTHTIKVPIVEAHEVTGIKYYRDR